jgi:hypothetical protein
LLRALILLLLLAGPALATTSAELSRAEEAFKRQDFKGVVDLLAPEVPLIRDEKDLARADYLLAESYFALGNSDRTKEELTALLVLDPHKELDAVVEDAKFYALFGALKQELKQRLDEIEAARKKAEADRNRPTSQLVVTRIVHQKSRLEPLVPFGFSQFKNEQSGKGFFFLTTEGVTGGTSLALFLWQAFEYGIPSRVPFNDQAAIDALRSREIVQIGAGALFLLLYGWQVLDGYSHQLPDVTETKSLVPLPASTTILPSVGPGYAGVSATWRF